MNFFRKGQLKKEIISVGKRLYFLRMSAGRAGNLSCRLDEKKILITATGTALGSLSAKDIVEVELGNADDAKAKNATSEFPLHDLIHRNFSGQAVIHCHPSLTNAYFAVAGQIQALTFESKLYLGNIPVVKQETPAVTDPQAVVEALKVSRLAVLKNHGVVAIAGNFKDALYLVETLEEAVRTAAVARLFKADILDVLNKELKQDLAQGQAYEMFSREHIQAIVDLVNKDEFIAAKGKELDLTLQLAIKLDGREGAHKFIFEKGKIVSLGADDQAPYVISAPKEVWEMVFLGKIEPFVATTQGKMKLKGELGKLSRWYVPFSRLFELFKQVRIR